VVLIELGAMQFPVQGLLELDTAAGTVRLAALDDFGVTLFRLTITRADERVDFLLPLVPQGTEVTRSVAASLRRIYLELARPTPDPGRPEADRRQRAMAACAAAAEGLHDAYGGGAAVVLR
jgi:hypothetical protein